MKKVKRISGLILAVMMLLSVTVSAANGIHELKQVSGVRDGVDVLVGTLEGTYDIKYDSNNNIEAYTIEVGTVVTILLPTKGLYITDTTKQYWEDDCCVYTTDRTVNGGTCTVTNLVKAYEKQDTYYEDYEYYKSGIKVVFNIPGKFYIETFGANLISEPSETSGFYRAFTVVEKGGIAKMKEAERLANTAKYNNAKVLVNGVPTTFEAYNFSGNNYFKLRDIAMAVNGTEKQFEVSWDALSKNVIVTPNKAYTPVGGELVAGDGKDKMGTPNENPLVYGFMAEYLKAYNINGNNYFKLRDVCRLLDIGVTWDNATKTIGIDTTIPYTE